MPNNLVFRYFSSFRVRFNPIMLVIAFASATTQRGENLPSMQGE